MQGRRDATASQETRLRQLQRDLQGYLLGEQSPIADAIVPAPPLPIAERLAIYRDAYRVRLIEALDDTYPVVHSVLGDEVFVALGEAFVAAHVSVHRSIRWYGRELPKFLGQTSPYAEQPILAELALLEWTLAEVFDAADAEPKPRATFSAVDASGWSELRFEFHPSVRRLHLQWNTTAVWQAMGHDETPPDPLCAEHPVPWLLWRQNLRNYFRSMTPDEAAALDSALRGSRFGEICEALAQWLPEDEIPLRAANLLGIWADSGIIVSIS
ncbi:MAG TPA: DNA-binding domain-containing protein [Candidatus Binataceae bacterium]|nr:DNA-binding domain-containing protein [Candidatus Binataceae bacterium]